MILRNNRGQFIKGCKFWLGRKRPNISKLFKGKKHPWCIGKLNKNWKGGPRKKHCIQCGKEYLVKICEFEKSKYCSKGCRNKFLFTGKKNNNWKGGISKEKDRLKASEGYKKWRLKVFQRDRFACKQCGYRSKKSKSHGDKQSDIHAHHIVPMERNIKLCLKEGNGITLCIKCHRLTYGKEEKFAKVFKEILRDYMPNNPKG